MKIAIKGASKIGCITILKRAVIILALLIPVSFPSISYSTTLQDIYDWMANNPPPQGCEYKLEQTVNQYVLKRLCYASGYPNIVYKRESWLFNANVYEPRFNSSTNVSACTGDGRSAYDIGGGYGFYVYQFNSKTKTVEYKCNGTVTEDIRGFSGYNYAFGLKDPCHTNTWIVNTCTPTETIAMTWTIECQDIDGDGYYAYDSANCPEGNDCDDNDPAINPGAPEICDGKDNNCNGEIDEGACSCSLNVTLNSSANIANGNLSHSQTLNGKGQRSTNTVLSDFTLYYNSLYSNSGYLGTRWAHSYDITLKEFADGSVLLREGNDRRLYILSNGSYINQAGDYSTLVKNTDGTYLLTKKDGIKYTFDAAGKLTKIEDRRGYTLTFVYSGSNLTEITDSVGRKTTFTYDSSSRMTQLITHNSQLTTFNYNSSGYLTKVTDQAGYSWTYTYDFEV